MSYYEKWMGGLKENGNISLNEVWGNKQPKMLKPTLEINFFYFDRNSESSDDDLTVVVVISEVTKLSQAFGVTRHSAKHLALSYLLLAIISLWGVPTHRNTQVTTGY